MNILFNIDYHLSYGEDMIINVIAPNGQVRAQRMSVTNDGKVNALLRISTDGIDRLDYYYTVERAGQPTRSEWTTQPHRLDLSLTGVHQYTTNDIWREMPEDTYLYTSAFTQCVNRRSGKQDFNAPPAQTILRMKVRAPQLRGNERLVLAGNEPILGEWNLDNALPMTEIAPNEWIADIDAEKIKGDTFEYKFVAMPEESDDTVMQYHRHHAPLWETCCNRVMEVPVLRRGEIMEMEHSQAFFEIANPRLAGTLVPVFSLRSEGSYGVGDFGDLRLMIDWVAYTGQRVLQILPINDTTVTHTWKDSYPYSCISIFALHPQYVDFRQLPALKDKKKAAEFEALREELNALRQIDYERVNKAKREYLRLIFAQEGQKVLASTEFKRWFAEEQHWLVPYAQYCVLRDINGTADFSQWKDHRTWNEEDRNSLVSSRSKAYKEASYHYFVQFILARQMQAAHEYARQKHVILKGDIPIGVNRHGCDVWQEPRYFNLNGQAGAPPDPFSAKGQNWGFPTYNWDAMIADGCRWWVRRFQNMQKYFDAYRIDHVLGFFRIWEIPVESVHGLLGQFQPSLGFTRAEIESYGLMFREDFFCRPYITEEVLSQMFGDRAEQIAHTYFEPFQGPYLRFQKEYDTQCKIKEKVEDADLREALYSLVSDVLFLRDHKRPDLYHPRISVQYDYIYHQLSEADKAAFNRLYDDYFYHRNTHFWYREAMKKLPRLIEATRMLVCAEDLGMVPDCVPWVINDLKILSLELQSMPKEQGLEFGIVEQYPYRSVCTIDSHDMPTLRMWWDEDLERAAHYYHNVLHRRDEAPHPMPAWLARDVIERNLMSPSMLCILSLQDWLAIDETIRLADANAERINIPANPHHYWRYRMHVNIEELLSNQRFCDDIMGMIHMNR